MGRAIEAIAQAQCHETGLVINIDNLQDFTNEKLRGCDIAIEFTGPETAVENIKKCIAAGLPVVCGSTGWLAHWQEVVDFCTAQGGGLLYASNFSVGVNVFFELNKTLARLMEQQPGYDVTLTEVHHTAKKDAPSGTAISLAEQVLAEISRKKNWVNHAAAAPEELAIFSERTDPAPGTHHVKYTSVIDDIEIIHTAHSREGFAAGAIRAAVFMAGKKGIYTMRDVLGLY